MGFTWPSLVGEIQQTYVATRFRLRTQWLRYPNAVNTTPRRLENDGRARIGASGLDVAVATIVILCSRSGCLQLVDRHPERDVIEIVGKWNLARLRCDETASGGVQSQNGHDN